MNLLKNSLERKEKIINSNNKNNLKRYKINYTYGGASRSRHGRVPRGPRISRKLEAEKKEFIDEYEKKDKFECTNPPKEKYSKPTNKYGFDFSVTCCKCFGNDDLQYTNNYNEEKWKRFKGVLKVDKNLCDRTNEEKDNITDDEIFKEFIGFYVNKEELEKFINYNGRLIANLPTMKKELNIKELKKKIKNNEDIYSYVKYFRQYSCLWAQTFNYKINSNTYSKRIFSNKEKKFVKKFDSDKNKNIFFENKYIRLYKNITEKLLNISELLNKKKNLINEESELNLTRWDGDEDLKPLKSIRRTSKFDSRMSLTQLDNIWYMLYDLDKNLKAKESNSPGPAKIFNENKIKENIAKAEEDKKALDKLKDR